MKKKCPKCSKEFPATSEYFYKDKSMKGGLRSYCKECEKESRKKYYQENKEERKEYQKEYNKNYNQENKEKIKEYSREYKQKNKEKIKEQKRKWHEENKQKIKKRKKKYYQENKAKYRKYQKNRYHNNIEYRLLCSCRNRIRKSLKNNKANARTKELIGCSIPELKKHLEKQFDDKMSWENYGSYWHVDHIIPCASFDFTDPEQQKECFHYTNLQPLEAIENMKKGAKILF